MEKAKKRHFLKRLGKMALCLILCVAITFCCIYKPPVKAEASAILPILEVFGPVLVSAALVALGLAASADTSDASLVQECQNIWNQLSNEVKLTTIAVGLMGYKINAEFLKAVWQVFSTNHPVMAALMGGATGTAPTTAPGAEAFWNTVQQNMMLTPNAAFSYDLSGLMQSTYGVESFCRIRLNGSQYISSVSNLQVLQVAPVASFAGTSSYTYMTFGDTVIRRSMLSDGKFRVELYSTSQKEVFEYATFYAPDLLATDSMAFVSFCYGQQVHLALMYTWYGTPVRFFGDVRYGTGYYYPGQDVINVADNEWWAQQVSALNTKLDTLLDRIGEALDVPVGSIEIPVPGDRTVPDTFRDTQDKVIGKRVATEEDLERDKVTNQDKVGDKTKADEGEQTKPGEGEGDKPGTGDKPKPDFPALSLPELIFKEKFPFCLPWDLYNAIAGMVSTPTPIKFVIPFLHVPSLGWNFDITLDLAPYEKLAVISRWGFSLLWTIGLILISRKIIGD